MNLGITGFLDLTVKGLRFFFVLFRFLVTLFFSRNVRSSTSSLSSSSSEDSIGITSVLGGGGGTEDLDVRLVEVFLAGGDFGEDLAFLEAASVVVAEGTLVGDLEGL
jgi:hypothetical protein